jgi:D-sedoheptulose 7-phosphate isomerase
MNREQVQWWFRETISLNERLLQDETLQQQIIEVAHLISNIALFRAARSTNKILVCGCGGSLAEHLVSELMNRFSMQRETPIASVDLTACSALLTAVSNDYSFDDVFAKQVMALGQAGDLLVAFSTSGRSPSVRSAILEAGLLNMQIVYITGAYEVIDSWPAPFIHIKIPDDRTPVVQHAFIQIIHAICDLVDIELTQKSAFQEVE